MKKNALLILSFFVLNFIFANESDTTKIDITDSAFVDQLKEYFEKDSISKNLDWEYGTVSLGEGLAELEIPQGYKYLNPKQSDYVLTELWGNPSEPTLGMIFPDSIHPLSDNFTYAVDISYSEEGYIEDDDASDIDYTDLLLDMQKEAREANPQRKQLGYPEIELVGWASAPFYDEENKKLHWAKELHFEGQEVNTLNYNIRVLGRKGYINMNVIGDMTVLPMVKTDINNIISSVDFKEGNKYSDFDPDMDEVAAYGIGGLIAGKVLAKAGFFAAILKFWKVIAIGAVGLFAAFKKKIFGGNQA